VELIEAWEKLGVHVYYYEYYWKVNWFDLPWPIVHSMKEDIPWYHRCGHGGVYTQFTEANGWTLYPVYYIAAKLLWNVHADVDALFDKMCRRLFGEAGSAIREYYRVMEESMANAGIHFPGHGIEAGRKVFTDEVLEKMAGELARAHRMARGETVKQRLAKLDLSYAYTRGLMNYADLREHMESEQAGKQAIDVLEGLIARVREDRGTFHHVISRNIAREHSYLGKELTRLRERVERM
jgi:hypothetical protein